MLSYEEFQNSVSAEKQLLSFEEFQSHVLKVFNASEEECDFSNFSYAFYAEVSYQKYQWLQFVVRYITDSESCYYGRWICVKRYDKACKTISDSLNQGIKALERQTEESIKEEIDVFKRLEK
ncbi:MAG: hypothetical protein ACK5SY_00570 [bacterium]|jgi:hypothetical protein|uniref:Uncharacterized protein n=1 Tax=Bacteriophage sp. TaxID=38018 RepID=A0A7G9A3Y2_9VIRU|nr:MAG: hypothetical protein [Bacteriophage sp.]